MLASQAPQSRHPDARAESTPRLSSFEPSALGLLLLAMSAAIRCATQEGVAECSIQTVLSGLSAIKSDEECRALCNSESGDCPAD
eukprot:SAG22_NODE_106_length_19904_cov_14.387175_17_plen_85_part_00